MSFLAPVMLLALPLAAMPLIIHLLALRRYQTIEWAAMPLLFAAQQTSRGYARLRQWLILALRTAAVAALLIAAARPLMSSRFGITLGQADAAIVLLDRSPSMQQRTRGVSKLAAVVDRLAAGLDRAAANRWLLVESGRGEVREIDGPASLDNLPQTTGLAASADIVAMLEAAYEYVRQNELGQTELWIASDFRSNDWQPQSGRWTTLTKAIEAAPWQVRVHLLAYDAPADGNRMIRIERLRTESRAGTRELSLSLLVEEELGKDEESGIDDDASAAANSNRSGNRQTPAEESATEEIQSAREATVQLEIDGARTATTVPMSGRRGRLNDYRIPLAPGQERGWGKVTLPADANPADNHFYFVYDEPPPRRTAIVAEAGSDTRALRLAAEIAPDAAAPARVETYAPEETSVLPWEATALVIWQAPLPTGDAARRIAQFVDSGGQVFFFPPDEADNAKLDGMGWGAWQDAQPPQHVDSWQTGSRLLGPTDAGAALPVGQIRVQRFRDLLGEGNVLARLDDGSPLIVQASVERGDVVFWATTPRPEDSNLGQQGVALYVAVQRAMEQGRDALAAARLINAGKKIDAASTWTPLAGTRATISSEQSLSAGAYASEQSLWAVNRPVDEDAAPTLSRNEILPLFGELDVQIVDGVQADPAGLAEQVSRGFLVVLALALLAEAGLTLPRRPAQERAA